MTAAVSRPLPMTKAKHVELDATGREVWPTQDYLRIDILGPANTRDLSCP